MENFNHWISLYSWVFTILIISLSLNSVFFIKDKMNKFLSFIVFTGIYATIISYFWKDSFWDHAEGNRLGDFIYKTYISHLFVGLIPFCISVIAFILLIVRVLYNWKNNKNR